MLTDQRVPLLSTDIEEEKQTPNSKKGVVDQLVTQVRNKIAKDKAEKLAASETVPYGKILMTYADGMDKLLMSLGYFFAILTGIGLPSFTYLFGSIINNFTDPTESIVD